MDYSVPTIYLKDRVFSKIVNSGHYNDYERVLERGVELFLMEEQANLEQQTPESVRRGMSDPLVRVMEKNLEMIPRQDPEPGPSPVLGQSPALPTCPRCNKPVLENDHYGLQGQVKYHLACLR